MTQSESELLISVSYQIEKCKTAHILSHVLLIKLSLNYQRRIRRQSRVRSGNNAYDTCLAGYAYVRLWWKSNIGVLFNGIGVRRIGTFPSPFHSAYDFVASDPVKAKFESEAEAEEPANYDAWNRAFWLVYSLTSVCDSDNLVVTGS